MKDKNIILGVTGGIAAYKAADLTRLIIKAGGSVWPVMTRAATEFITPLTLETLAKNPALTGLFNKRGNGTIDHIELAAKADLIIVAPATANIIGKVASGIADDLLTTIIMATRAPILFAPAMNTKMYENPIVQDNIQKLKRLNYLFVGPEEGELACGEKGKGRLSEPESILDAAIDCLSRKDLTDDKILVTTGPTRESIDPVRFISNPSSGRMGHAIAIAARRRGAEVVLVSGPSSLPPPGGVTLINVTTAEEMAEASLSHFPQSTIVIMAAAVSDLRPRTASKRKINKEDVAITIETERTRDILKEMGKRKKGQFLVGFALETDDIVKNAQNKLEEKNLDLIAANDPRALGAEISQITLINKDNKVETLPPLSKGEVANRILDKIIKSRSRT
ncbi:MAG: bifunctional phosphopantothenoylcysteine decarboxylase/phosphopantothenate--cysteine ligase CoaBC [Thermodesulfobacteriota bacterium]